MAQPPPYAPPAEYHPLNPPIQMQPSFTSGGYPPSQGGYPPPQGGYPPTQGEYPPPQGGYPPAQGEYPPPQGMYPPSMGGYPPPQGVYAPSQGGYQPSQGGYPPSQGGYPPPQGGYPPPQGGYGPPSPMPYAPAGGYQPPPAGQPITEPPGGAWMNVPQRPLNCPPGLEYLTSIDQLLIHQKVEILEALTGFETKNKFTIKNSLGQKVYYAVEDSDCLTRNCCGPLRPFDMKIMDNFQNQVIHLSRPLACDSCCFPCCLQSMEVSSPPGALVGSVQQEWSICKPSFTIRNEVNDIVLRIEGPFCVMNICGDVEFKVLSADGEHEVGRISKQWSGLVREIFTDSDYFGITFPMDLDVKMKAVMIGACFLIDAMFFEKTQNHD